MATPPLWRSCSCLTVLPPSRFWVGTPQHSAFTGRFTSRPPRTSSSSTIVIGQPACGVTNLPRLLTSGLCLRLHRRSNHYWNWTVVRLDFGCRSLLPKPVSVCWTFPLVWVSSAHRLDHSPPSVCLSSTGIGLFAAAPGFVVLGQRKPGKKGVGLAVLERATCATVHRQLASRLLYPPGSSPAPPLLTICLPLSSHPSLIFPFNGLPVLTPAAAPFALLGHARLQLSIDSSLRPALSGAMALL